MEIKRIFKQLNLSNVNKNNSAKKKNEINKDEIAFSSEVKKYAKLKKYIDIVKKVPDVRKDVVEKVKKKINLENYFENVDLDKLADKIIDPDL